MTRWTALYTVDSALQHQIGSTVFSGILFSPHLLQIERHIMKAIPGGHNLFVPGKKETTMTFTFKFTSMFCNKWVSVVDQIYILGGVDF